MRVSMYRRMSVPLRAALLMPLAALTVHQLRYDLAFGGRAPAQLAREGHGYLASVEPFVLLLSALALGALVGRLAHAWGASAAGPGRDSGPAANRVPGANCVPGALAKTWILCAVVLFALYCGQELAEGAFASGHPAGIAGILGHGGFAAAPLALLVAAALTLALRAAETLVRLAAGHRPSHHAAGLAGVADLPPPSGRVRDWRLDPRSGVVAGRAPPPSALPALI